MTMLPISVDYPIYVGDNDSVEYAIYKVDGSTNTKIYSGKAFKRPGDEDIHIVVNDICANYMTITLPTTEGVTIRPLDEFLVVANGIEQRVFFYADYSERPQENRYVLSEPINGRLDARQYLLYTEYDQHSYVVSRKDGDSIEGVYEIYADEGRISSLLINLPKQTMLRGQIGVNDQAYEVVESCAKYALYYVNAFGGWDSFLIEGNHKETDSIVRHNHSVEYDNRNISNRGRLNYLNEITKKITLYTSWLTDEQSSRMHHLLNATQVYLFDLETQEMKPILLTNTSTEYKTYKGNGRKLVNYEIEVELANEKIRR